MLAQLLLGRRHSGSRLLSPRRQEFRFCTPWTGKMPRAISNGNSTGRTLSTLFHHVALELYLNSKLNCHERSDAQGFSHERDLPPF
jgi:hypothetical protein